MLCLLVMFMHTKDLNVLSNIAYNIINGMCAPVKDQFAPIYITIGDGENIEGLAINMTVPQPNYSAY